MMSIREILEHVLNTAVKRPRGCTTEDQLHRIEMLTKDAISACNNLEQKSPAESYIHNGGGWVGVLP